jgi:hypothetical protein
LLLRPAWIQGHMNKRHAKECLACRIYMYGVDNRSGLYRGLRLLDFVP